MTSARKKKGAAAGAAGAGAPEAGVAEAGVLEAAAAKAGPAEDESASRRTFLNRLWAGLGLLALVEMIFVGVAFFRRGKPKTTTVSDAAVVTCGAVDQYAPGSVTAFVRGRFYLARLGDGGFLALSRQCTHLGCTLPWDEAAQRFACPCHASTFDITGAVINTPATRSLNLYPLTIENRIVKVDTREPVRRSGFEKKQVVYPKAS